MGNTAAVYSDNPWWDAYKRGQEPHQILVGLAENLRQKQSVRYDNWRRFIAVFEWGYRAAEYIEVTEAPINEYTVAFNAAQNVIETMHAKICKSRILPMPLTTGGNYIERETAKLLGKALEGEFDENDVDQIKEDVVMEGLILGAGAAKVSRKWGKICIEHVPLEDLFVDDAEGRRRNPRNLIEKTFADRFVMAEEYGREDPDLYGAAGDRRRAILNAPQADTKNYARTEHDQVAIIEAWHLPSGPDAKDGRHVICINGATLVDEEWEQDTFPFAFYIPRKRRRAFWGMSVLYNLAPGQREFERLTMKIQKAHARMGGAHIIASRQANVNPREIDNDQGTFFEFDGQMAPMAWNPDPVNPQTYQYKESIPNDMMRYSGVSALSASSQVPAGLSQASGKALQVFEDFEAERLLGFHRELERWILSLSKLIIREARVLVEEDQDYGVHYAGKRALESVKWSDVLMDENEYVLKIFPISQLSKQPAAKFAQLQEMLNAGAITVEQFKRLYDLPDLESEMQLDSADTDIIDKNLDRMVLQGKYVSPEPFDNLKLIVQRAGKFYNLMRQQDVPDARLELVRQYISDAQNLMQQAAPPAAPPALGPPPVAASPGGPPGMGPPPPPAAGPPIGMA